MALIPAVQIDLHDCPSCGGRQVVREWRRDEPLRRWVGVCRGRDERGMNCTYGRTFKRGDEPYVRTDEQLERREVPMIPLFDQWVAQNSHGLGYEPW